MVYNIFGEKNVDLIRGYKLGEDNCVYRVKNNKKKINKIFIFLGF